MDAEVESVMASSQDQREEELQVNTNSINYLDCIAVSVFPSRERNTESGGHASRFCLPSAGKETTQYCYTGYYLLNIVVVT